MASASFLMMCRAVLARDFSPLILAFRLTGAMPQARLTRACGPQGGRALRQDRDVSLRMTGGVGKGLSVWRQLKIVTISHPENRARLAVALLFASVFIVSRLSSYCASGYLPGIGSV